MTRARTYTDSDLREEIRKTLDAHGWGQSQTGGTLAIDVTLERIAGKVSDAEREALSARLWAIWNLHFEIMGA